MKIKDDLHHFIDSIEDEALLRNYLHIIQGLKSSRTGDLWNTLTEDQKKELIVAYEESFDQHNLLTHDVVKQQHAQWLKQ